MKKICIILFLLSLCVLTLAACDSSLSQPTGLIFDVETQTLTWSAVKGAKFYTVQISGQEREITTKTTSVSLEDLAAGDYEIRIRANSDGKAFDDSGWTVYQFTREEESGLKYELINNDTAYQLVSGGTASGDVVMEDTFRGKPVVAIADNRWHKTNSRIARQGTNTQLYIVPLARNKIAGMNNNHISRLTRLREACTCSRRDIEFLAVHPIVQKYQT